MISFPHCKINIGLQVLERRADGYHAIQTAFYPLPFFDVLEILPASTSASEPDFTLTGLNVTKGAAENLCVKAYQLLKKDFKHLPPAHIHLHKNIPAGAGLGGGSSDAAFTLNTLNTVFGLNISADQLQHYALALGSDCPFFLLNKPVLASGRGEIFTPLAVDLSDYHAVLLFSDLHISTAWAFGNISPARGLPNLAESLLLPIENWRNTVVNDFEAPVFALHPLLAAAKQTLYEAGAVYASLTGTGSVVYGLFKHQAPLLHLPAGITAKWMQLAAPVTGA